MDEQTIDTSVSTETTTVETPTLTPGVQTQESATLVQDSIKPEIPAKFMKDGQPDYDALTKAYTSLESKLGSKVPVSDAADYDFAFQSPDSWNQDEFEAFKSQAVELGLSKDQFNTAMALYEKNMMALIDQYTPNADRAQATLEGLWGDEYQSNMKSAAKAIQVFYPEAFEDAELGSNPKFIQVMSKIGKQLNEDKAPGVVNTGAGAGMSKLEIEGLMARPDYRSNPEIQKIVRNWYEARQ